MAATIRAYTQVAPEDLPIGFVPLGDGSYAPMGASLLYGWDSNAGAPVRIAADATGILSTTAGGGGGPSSTVDVTDRALRLLGHVTVDNLLATQPVSGTVAVSNFPASQAITAAALPLPTGAAQDRITAVSPSSTRLTDGTTFYDARARTWTITETVPVSGTFWQVTQPISAVALPLPTGAAQEHTSAISPHSVRLTTGAAFYDSRDRNWTITETVPVSGTFWPVTQPVSGTFWQATQPISAVSLPLPSGASTETTLSAMSAKLPAVLVGGRLDTNIGAFGGTAIAAVALPTGGDGQAALPVYINAIQKLTYDAGARGIVTGALTANTAKAIWSIEHAVTATKTVRVRRIMVHMLQSTALAGLIDVQITRGTAASSAGTAVTPQPHRPGDAAAEAVVKTLPTIVAATVIDTIPAGGFATTTTLYSPPVLVYDWQEGGETKPYILRAGTLDSLVINLISNAAHNVACTVSVDFTEES